MSGVYGKYKEDFGKRRRRKNQDEPIVQAGYIVIQRMKVKPKDASSYMRDGLKEVRK